MSWLQIGSFSLAALGLIAWLIAMFAVSATDPAYFLAGATLFLVIGFGSLMVDYAKVVGPEWNDDNG